MGKHWFYGRERKKKPFETYDNFDTVNNAALEQNMTIKMPESIKKGKSTHTVVPTTASKANPVQTWTGYQGATTHVWCDHPGDKIVFEQDDKKIYAAAGRNLNEFSGKWDLIIDLAANIRVIESVIKRNSTKRFESLKPYLKKPGQVPSEVLALDWPDMGVIGAGLEFWERLWNMLPKTTVVACMGGHGRTGTCIAALMIAAGMDYYSAIDTVRAEHCDKAIESVAQELYLHRLYMDKLKNLIIGYGEAGNEIEVKEIQLDLDYAETHVPNNYSSHGMPEPEKKIIMPDITKPGTSKTSFSGTEVDDSDDDTLKIAGEDYLDIRTKSVNGEIYCEVCIDPKCEDPDCITLSHQGWVLWDQAMMRDI